MLYEYIQDIVLSALTSFGALWLAKQSKQTRIRCWRASFLLPMKHVGVSGHYRCVHVPRILPAVKLSRIPVRSAATSCLLHCACVMLPFCQAHEREQLREAGKRKMSELRSLKAAVVQAHAAAKLQQQQNTSQTQSAGLLGSPHASSAAESMQEQQQKISVTSQVQQHAAAVSHEQAGASSSQVPGPTATSSSGADSSKHNSPGLGTAAMSDSSSRAASSGFLQPSSSSAVAAAASAVAAGAAAVAANAAARAGAAAPSGLWNETPLTAAPADPLQLQQQQQQQEQAGQGQSHDVGACDGVSPQDPMVDMLLLQVCAVASTPVCCSSVLPADWLQQAACAHLAHVCPC
jgi:hypothetical protein